MTTSTFSTVHESTRRGKSGGRRLDRAEADKVKDFRDREPDVRERESCSLVRVGMYRPREE